MGKLWDQYLAGRSADCGISAPAATSNLWSAAAQKMRPISWERVAVVGEELGTQAKSTKTITMTVEVYEAMLERIDVGVDRDYNRITALEAELVQLRRYNADLYEMARARGAEVEQLRRDNELLVQLANDQRAAHVAELAKLMASAAQTVVVAPEPAPEFPLRALTHQRQVVGLLTEGYRD